MEEEWYYGVNESLGPVSRHRLIATLQKGELGPDAKVLVLHPESDRWVPADEEPRLLFGELESGAKFSIREALEFGFRSTINLLTGWRPWVSLSAYLLTSIGLGLLFYVADRFFVQEIQVERTTFEASAVFTISYLLVWFTCKMVLMIGWLRVRLIIAEPGYPRARDLFSHAYLVIDFIGLLLVQAIVGLPALAVIILSLTFAPKVIAVVLVILVSVLQAVFLGLPMFVADYSMVDFDAGPIASIQSSFAITKGARFELGLFLLTLFALNALAILTIVGPLIAIPATLIATAFVYRRLLHETDPTELPEELMKRLTR